VISAAGQRVGWGRFGVPRIRGLGRKVVCASARAGVLLFSIIDSSRKQLIEYI
jgi:hypothetical protein